MMLCVLSGNYNEAYEYVHKNGLSSDDWVYFSCVFCLSRFDAGEFVRVGTWANRSDLTDALGYLRSLGWRERDA